MSSRTGYMLVATIGSVLVAVAIGCYYWPLSTRSYYRRALPPTATDVHEKSVDMVPDWTLFMKARLSREAYDVYIRKVGLGPPSIVQTNSPWAMWADGYGWGATPPTWWNPTSLDPDTVGASSGHATTLAKYENGYLYLVDFKY